MGEDPTKLKTLFVVQLASHPFDPSRTATWEIQAAQNMSQQLGLAPGKVAFPIVGVKRLPAGLGAQSAR